MHRLGRQKRLYISYVRTAIIAVLFLIVAIPFVKKVANGGKTYTPDDRYMVVLNGQEIGYVSDASMAQSALTEVRTQINATNSGVTLVETDINVYKEATSGDVLSEEALTASMYAALTTHTNNVVNDKDNDTAYTVRIDDFTVTLASKDEVVELFEAVKNRYLDSNEFTVELVEDTEGSYNSLKTNLVSADIEINEVAQLLASMNGNIAETIEKEDIVLKDGVLSIGFEEEVEIIETKADKNNIVSVEEAYELVTKEHAEKEMYTIKQGDTLSAIAKLHEITLDELCNLNGIDCNTTIYVSDQLIVTVPASEITVVVVEESSYDEEYDAPIQYVDNNSMYIGNEKVIQNGVKGTRGVVALISYVNGVESGREIISETVYTEAVPTIIERGTLTPPTYIKPVYCNKITSAFGNRFHPITGVWSFHTGVDYGVTTNTPVRASSSGTVVRASWNGGYGYCVDIRHADGSLTRYAHLNSFAVAYGQTVRQGQVIAYSGNTGNSTGPHLHFELHLRGTLVNPVDYVK